MRVIMEKIKQNIRDQVLLSAELKGTRQSVTFNLEKDNVQAVQMAMLIEALRKINSTLEMIATSIDPSK